MWPFKRKDDDEGLKRKWVVGEHLPWKGITFVVSKVEKEKIELQPVGLTWSYAKKLKEAKEN